MNKKIIVFVLAIAAIGFLALPAISGQQANDYRAYGSGQFISEDFPTEGTTATLAIKITYVPVYPSATYTLTAQPLYVVVDMDAPQTINPTIASAVKAQGNSLGYNVIKVYLPSYEMKVP